MVKKVKVGNKFYEGNITIGELQKDLAKNKDCNNALDSLKKRRYLKLPIKKYRVGSAQQIIDSI